MDGKIEVVIGRGGKMRYQAKGIPGEACVTETAWINEIFGQENIESEEKTSEYYEQEIAVNTQTVRNR